MSKFSRIFRTSQGFVLGISLLAIGEWSLVGCQGSGRPNTTTEGGMGGEGGCPVRLPEPQFIVEIRAEDGPVPLDTRITAEWSAADEPAFVLSDPKTWKTLDDGVNLVCHVDRTQPPPQDLSVLVCELWTSGAVNLLVEGTGYSAYKDTLKPVMSEFCNEPMSTMLPILLRREMVDGGPVP